MIVLMTGLIHSAMFSPADDRVLAEGEVLASEQPQNSQLVRVTLLIVPQSGHIFCCDDILIGPGVS